MLIGHLDEVSHKHLAGWAANTLNPDVVMQVSIFVNGWKVAQIECNQYRRDLKESGYGEGRHGFRYDFPQNLELAANNRIAVWFAETGVPLGNGEIILAEDGSSQPPRVDAEGMRPLMLLPAPTNQRALFELLALFKPECGIYQLLRRVDFGRWTTTHAHDAVFGRLATMHPTSSMQSRPLVPDYFNDLLCSDEFQQLIIPSLLEAFADKRRLLFVHIPKCAGTDLTEHLRARYPSLDQQIMEPQSTSKSDLFKQVREFVELTRFFDAVFLRGHFALNYYLDNRLVRSSDRLFSIARDPMEIVISSVNYVVMRIHQDLNRQVLSRDTKAWISFLGMDKSPDGLSDEFAAQICMKTLYDKRIVIPNSMCKWLGGGDARTVLERLAEHDIEITDTTRYNGWLLERWGINSITRKNVSTKFFTAASLKPEDRDYLDEITSEDRKVYATLEKTLTANGRAWVVGRELLGH
jgi:hypothetical protein